MASFPGSVARHPTHPVLIALPIGLCIFSLISDVVYLMNGVVRAGAMLPHTRWPEVEGALS